MGACPGCVWAILCVLSEVHEDHEDDDQETATEKWERAAATRPAKGSPLLAWGHQVELDRLSAALLA